MAFIYSRIPQEQMILTVLVCSYCIQKPSVFVSQIANEHTMHMLITRWLETALFVVQIANLAIHKQDVKYVAFKILR